MTEKVEKDGRVVPTGLSASPEPEDSLRPAGFDPSREDHALIESCAQVAEEYAGEMSYHSYFTSTVGNQDAAMFYHRRFEMLCAVAARIRSKISPEHVLEMALARPGMKRWSDIITKDQIGRFSSDSDGSGEAGQTACGLDPEGESAVP